MENIKFMPGHFDSFFIVYCAGTTALRPVTETTISCQRKGSRLVRNVSRLITDIVPKWKLNLFSESIKKKPENR